MKKLTIVTFLLVYGLFHVPGIFAQESDLFSPMEEHLTSDEKEKIEEAKNNIQKGDKMESQIKTEDSKIQKYSGKKQKKFEKKSVDVKELRIKQAQYYEKGYASVYNVYSNKMSNLDFFYEEDLNKANNMLEEASADNEKGKNGMKSYKSVSPKDLKKDISYSKLKNDLQGALNSYQSAIRTLIDVYSIFLDQESKKQLDEEEQRVWDNAVSENTVYGFQSYLADFPSGKYASEARSRISELEEEERRKADEANSRSLKGNLVFQVQIAASRKALPKWKIARFYKATNEVTTKNYDGWYKYAVGEFKSYDEAKKFAAAMKSKVKGAFVVAYLNGEKLDIKEAIKIQQ